MVPPALVSTKVYVLISLISTYSNADMYVLVSLSVRTVQVRNEVRSFVKIMNYLSFFFSSTVFLFPLSILLSTSMYYIISCCILLIILRLICTSQSNQFLSLLHSTPHKIKFQSKKSFF